MEPYTVRYMGLEDVVLVKWKVKAGSKVNQDTLLCACQGVNSKKTYKLTSDCNGTVRKTFFQDGNTIHGGDTIAHVELCTHPTVWHNMCAECGAYLKERETCSASVAMEHTIPDLLISEKEAQILGKEDEMRLLKSRQLVLLVDLDQTLIHTTNDDIPNNLKDVYHFQLPHGRPQDPRWYHTKFRPRTEEFLENMSKLFELHICTFGVRSYAHRIARFLDPDGKYFQQRILSRDECFHPTLKTSNLKALFPCGDSMVCIIDDRQDVWKNAPNLVHVKPYRFFNGTADINAPPEADKNVPDATETEFPGGNVKCSWRQAKIVKIRKKKANNGKQRKESKIKNTEGKAIDTQEEASCQDQGLEKDTNKKDCEKEKHGLESMASGEGDKLSDAPVLPLETDTVGTKNSEEQQETEKPTKTEADSSVLELSSGKVDEDEEEEEEEVEFIEWEDLDDYLIYLEDILWRIHSAFYEMYDEAKRNDTAPTPDLKKIVPYVRKKVLQGTNLLFSGVFPTNQVPEAAHAYQLAQAFGATVHQNFIPPSACGTSKDASATTHLVAARLGTEKVRMVSKYKDIKVVNPEWLWTCAERWEWVDERLYPLNDDTSKNCFFRDSPDPNTGQKPVLDSVGLKSTNNGSVETALKPESDSQLANLGMSSEAFKAMLKDFDDDFLTDSDNDESEKEEIEKTEATESNVSESESGSQKEDRVLRSKVLLKRKFDESSSEAESLSADFPKGWKKTKDGQKRQKMDTCDEDDSSTEDSSRDQDDNGEDEEAEISASGEASDSEKSFASVDEMADILERDYLS